MEPLFHCGILSFPVVLLQVLSKHNYAAKNTTDSMKEIEDAKNTIPVSERVTAPSNAFFNVPYGTNGFTNVEYSQSVHNGTFV